MIENFQSYFTTITEKISNWIDTIITMLPNFLVAVIILVFSVLLAKLIRRLFRKTMDRLTNNQAINKLTASIIFSTVTIIGLFIALRVLKLDKTVTSLLAGLGIVGLALGFAFKDIVANFISGIYLAIKSPINVGDIIEYQDVLGEVKDIGLRASSIKTFRGQDVIIPNRLIIEDKYTHYSINNERRIDLDVGISYGEDLDKVEKVTITAIESIKLVDKNKPVDLFFNEFGDSAIIFTVRYWVKYEPGNYLVYLKALSQGIKNIKRAYDEQGITITFPIRTIDFGMKGGKTLSDMLNESEVAGK